MAKKIIIGEESDGFTIVVDGEDFRFDQEDSIVQLADVIKLIAPDQDVEYEEWY